MCDMNKLATLLAVLTVLQATLSCGGTVRTNVSKGSPVAGQNKCPSEPETGLFSESRCPGLDNDLDGVPDTKDSCPGEPEDKDGYKDQDGCPDADNDGDRVPDSRDQCPGRDRDLANGFARTKEDHDGFKDSDGCPEPDNDGDKICDDNDQVQKTRKFWTRICKGRDECPDEAEIFNKYRDDDGCPDKVPIEIRSMPKPHGVEMGRICFRSGSARIRRVSVRLRHP